MNTDQFKTDVTARVIAFYDRQFNDTYPSTSLARLVCGLDTDIGTLKTTITSLDESKAYLLEILEKFASTDLLDSFAKGGDEQMKSVISSYVPDLTELQLLALMEAIYPLSSV